MEHDRPDIEDAAVLVVQGSQGAGKTYSILQRWALLALVSKKQQLCSIVTDTLPALKKGAIKDFEDICSDNGIDYKGTKSPYVFIIEQWTFEFYSIDKESKARGGRRDRLFINEANRLTWKIAQQLISRTHREVIFDFNPVREFWAHTIFVDKKECAFVSLTYKDNEQLPKGEIAAIERHAPWGSSPDENYWRVFGEGKIGFVEGMIFKGYKTFDELPDNCDYQESMGVDWGQEDPMTAVKVWVDHNNMKIYWKEIFYASHAEIEELGNSIKDSEDYNDDIISCDHEPLSIRQLKRMEIAAIRAYKKAGIVADLRAIKQYKIFVHKDSENLLSEMDGYKYQTKNDKIVEYPDQTCDEHAIDAARYGTIETIRK